jgi:hypothetical protein
MIAGIKYVLQGQPHTPKNNEALLARPLRERCITSAVNLGWVG